MTNQELAEKLKALANQMLEVADKMWHHDSGDSACDDRTRRRIKNSTRMVNRNRKNTGK